MIIVKRIDSFNLAETNKFMTMMDKLQQSSEKIMIIATALKLEDVNEALRLHYFHVHFNIEKPDASGRFEILKLYTRNLQLSPKVDLELLAVETKGLVGAHLSAMVTQAIMRRLHSGSKEITAEMLQCDMPAITMTESEIPKIMHVKSPKVGFSGVRGLSNQKRQLLKSMQETLLHPHNLITNGTRKKTRSAFLCGPTGCGKSLLAEACAFECLAKVVKVMTSQLFSACNNKWETGIREVMSKAISSAPCVLLFDDIDTLLKSRDFNATSLDKIIIDIAEGFQRSMQRATERVFLVVATTHLDTISSVVRSKIVEQIFWVGLPNERARQEILKLKLPLLSDCDSQRAAKKLTGNYL